MNAPLFRSHVSYEWRIEEVDIDSEDIADGYSFNTADEAVADFRQRPPDGRRFELVLVRNRGNDAEGLVDRQWAYVGDDGQLPKEFGGGAKVPAAYHRALAKAVAALAPPPHFFY
jgi:hypothetical protein